VDKNREKKICQKQKEGYSAVVGAAHCWLHIFSNAYLFKQLNFTI